MIRSGVIFLLGVMSATATSQTQKPTQGHGAELHAHEHETADLVRASREQCQLAVTALSELTRALTEAKQAKDLEAIRTAVTGTDRPLARTQLNLDVCLDALKMIQAPPPSSSDSSDSTPPPDHVQPIEGRRDMPHAASAGQAVDPVCKMKVDVKSAPSRTYQGTTYHFCSEHDRAAFDREPTKYLRRDPIAQ